jgi:AAA domain
VKAVSNTEFVFAPATKEQAKARICLPGPAGSGKTWTSLLLAEVLAGPGGRIALIDTERKSASKYSDVFSFETVQMHRYDPRDLCRVLAIAAGRQFDVVIIDSLSHFWMGQDGMLELVDAAGKKNFGGNGFGGWKEATPIEREMIDAILAFPGHVIVTMRTKSEWVVGPNANGRMEPKRIGTKPIQRDGMEYEFDLVGELDLDNTLVVGKTRISALTGQVVRKPGHELGEQILEWLTSGVKVPTVRDYLAELAAAATADQVREVYRAVVGRNLGGAPCMSPGGQPTKLGDLTIARGQELRAQAAAAEAAASPAPVPATPNGHGPESGPKMSIEPQRSRIAMLYKRKLGITDRGVRLADASYRLGREIASTKEMTFAEAADAITWLGEQPDFTPDPVAEDQEAQTDQAPDALPGFEPDPALVAELATAVESAGSQHALNLAGMRINNSRRQGLIDNQVNAELMELVGERQREIKAASRTPEMAGVPA